MAVPDVVLEPAGHFKLSMNKFTPKEVIDTTLVIAEFPLIEQESGKDGSQVCITDRATAEALIQADSMFEMIGMMHHS